MQFFMWILLNFYCYNLFFDSLFPFFNKDTFLYVIFSSIFIIKTSTIPASNYFPI